VIIGDLWIAGDGIIPSPRLSAGPRPRTR
jgi:hypothetical protein